MLIYSYSDAQQNFTEILNKVKEEHEVLIQEENGACFVIKLLLKKKTDYNLPSIDLDLSRDEIVNFIRETRTR